MSFPRRNGAVAAGYIPFGRAGRIRIAAAFAAAIAGLNGCGAFLTPSSLFSLGTGIVGGMANGSIMGGSVLGALREDRSAGFAPGEASRAGAAAQATANHDTVQPIVSSVPDSACILLETAAGSVPCS